MPSFDITSEFNQQEVTNAIDQMNREIVNSCLLYTSDAADE